MKKLNKLSLPSVILIASVILGGFIYASQVNKQKSIERQQEIKIEQEKQAQEDKELKEQEIKTKAEQALNSCLLSADESYSNNWFRECKSQGKLTDRCIYLHETTFAEYAKKNNIPSETEKRLAAIDVFFKELDECSCRLSSYNAESIDKTLQNNKDECFRKYPLK